ncbi:hypothetical protein HBA55_10345 [Pseudomaricurvus alkylphenolicus]|uniref:glucosaminidase domain-containing protein n=1 Tax=Pseudomaricurvus alkylphenolicus TaxID=1306991 RepID=UPI00141F5D6C|nr:glucosaminidase domain-containing protein [Pseudomaricurvus alkylphenolicus]NIB39988.1 hypothetical protein [Pseudomaricurvus alkylphenolicus]
MSPPDNSAVAPAPGTLPGLLLVLFCLLCIPWSLYLAHWPRPEPPKPVVATPPPPVVREDIRVVKKRFYGHLLPAIKRQNRETRSERQQLLDSRNQLKLGESLEADLINDISRLAVKYRISKTSPDKVNPELIDALLLRVDEIPPSMALAQSAMESAWGRSRFAKQGNNYFGQWCFSAGCGMVPGRRTPGATHEVARYHSIDDAVGAYLLNINSHPAYEQVRLLRAEQRQQAGTALDSLQLVRGLEKYSAKGLIYIEELQSIIRFNRLQQYDDLPITRAAVDSNTAASVKKKDLPSGQHNGESDPAL